MRKIELFLEELYESFAHIIEYWYKAELYNKASTISFLTIVWHLCCPICSTVFPNTCAYFGLFHGFPALSRYFTGFSIVYILSILFSFRSHRRGGNRQYPQFIHKIFLCINIWIRWCYITVTGRTWVIFNSFRWKKHSWREKTDQIVFWVCLFCFKGIFQ